MFYNITLLFSHFVHAEWSVQTECFAEFKRKGYPDWEIVTETHAMVKCNDYSKKTTDTEHSLTTNLQQSAVS